MSAFRPFFLPPLGVCLWSSSSSSKQEDGDVITFSNSSLGVVNINYKNIASVRPSSFIHSLCPSPVIHPPFILCRPLTHSPADLLPLLVPRRVFLSCTRAAAIDDGPTRRVMDGLERSLPNVGFMKQRRERTYRKRDAASNQLG